VIDASRSDTRAGQRGAPATVAGQVVVLDLARIERALRRRGRYKYVHPRVVPEGPGWKVVSPNCSRSVDPAGGEIDIAWFVPGPEGRWQLFARDHARGRWLLEASELTLDAALARVCADPKREFWK
jgi:hypothetical protein